MDIWNAAIVVITIIVLNGYASLVWWLIRRHTEWLNLYLSDLLILLSPGRSLRSANCGRTFATGWSSNLSPGSPSIPSS